MDEDLAEDSDLLPLDTICGSACISLWSLELDDEDDDDC